MSFLSKVLIIFLIKLNIIYIESTDIIDIDPKGYILYCCCMGRFGNQAEQLLGSLQFSKSLDRTLILPPFIHYNHYKINFIPFDDYIDVEPIQDFHRVITLEKFMKHLAPIVWPEENRTILCYSSRGSPDKGCNPFDGNPFKSFWNHLGINWFPNGSLYHSPLLTDYNYAKDWKIRFKDIKVLAFVGAPSAFPTNGEAVKIQRYINLSAKVTKAANQYRESRGFARKPYLSVHLRQGSDWLKACHLLRENPELHQLFSSQQCSEPKSAQPLPYELCYPSLDTIIEQMKQIISKSKDKIETIYIASDSNNETVWQTIGQSLPNMTIITPQKTLWSSGEQSEHKPPDIITDIYLLSFANQFIGNCISSFSAFVSRYRTQNLNFKQMTHFLSENKLYEKFSQIKDEL